MYHHVRAPRVNVTQVTAIARPELLERVSEVVDSQLGSGARAGVDLAALTGGERGRLRNLLARLTTLAEAAAEVRSVLWPSHLSKANAEPVIDRGVVRQPISSLFFRPRPKSTVRSASTSRGPRGSASQPIPSSAGVQMNVRLLIDAEHSYFQPAIDYAALELMRRFNAGSVPVVYNTYQCYRTDTHERCGVAMTLVVICPEPREPRSSRT